MSIHVALIGPFPRAEGVLAGGVQASVARLAAALADLEGVEVTVVCPGDSAEVSLAGDVRVRRGVLVERRLVTTAFRAWRRFAGSQLDEIAPDIVHGHGLLAHGLAATDWPRGPRVVTAHGNPWFDAWAPRRSPRNLVNASLRVALATRTTRSADVVISPNTRRRVNLAVPPRRFAFIPNSVGERFPEATRQPVTGRVLFCGGATPVKGFDVLRGAWPEVLRRCPEASLEAVGFSVPADHAGLPAADVRGPEPASGLRAALGRAEVLVVPSHYEVSPNLIVEAWAAGTPVIASRVGGIPTLAAGAAHLVQVGDPVALAGAITDALRGRIDLDALVRSGRERAAAHLPHAVATRHRALYESLLHGESSGAGPAGRA
jgi:glycosyltransferase involved in cell wall biosynthesis